MDTVIFTMVVVFIGIVLLPPLAHRAHIPVIVLELLFGIAIGRSSVNLVPDNAIINFFSDFGLIFLMFLAGMEIDMSKINRNIMKKVLLIALASISVPFVSGVALSCWTDTNPFFTCSAGERPIGVCPPHAKRGIRQTMAVGGLPGLNIAEAPTLLVALQKV
jgi:Kef-type K+ transport system membrane component KefB